MAVSRTPNNAVTPHLGLEGVVEMLGTDTVLRLLNKPAGLNPRVSKRVPVGQIPAGMQLSDSANGYTRGGYIRRVPGYFISGVQLYVNLKRTRRSIDLPA